MDNQEIASAIGWMTVASATLAMMLARFTRYGYRATTVALLLASAGLLIAGHIWPAVAVLWLTTARFGYYLYLSYKVRLESVLPNQHTGSGRATSSSAILRQLRAACAAHCVSRHRPVSDAQATA